jgi:hypothetical protein
VLLQAFQASNDDAATFRTHLRVLVSNRMMFFVVSSSPFTRMLCSWSPTPQIEPLGYSGYGYTLRLVVASIFHVGRGAVEFDIRSLFLNIWSLFIFVVYCPSLKERSRFMRSSFSVFVCFRHPNLTLK